MEREGTVATDVEHRRSLAKLVAVSTKLGSFSASASHPSFAGRTHPARWDRARVPYVPYPIRLRRRHGCAIPLHPRVPLRDPTLATADEARDPCRSARSRHRYVPDRRDPPYRVRVRRPSSCFASTVDHAAQGYVLSSTLSAWPCSFVTNSPLLNDRRPALRDGPGCSGEG